MNGWLLSGIAIMGAAAAYALTRKPSFGPGMHIPSQSLTPTVTPPMTNDTSVYVTALADVEALEWCQSIAGMVTPVAVRRRGGGFARLTYKLALELANREGARLLTMQEHNAIDAEARAKGWQLSPVILPASAAMGSLAYANTEDAQIEAQIKARHIDPHNTPVSNAGKQWAAGAIPGKALNYGWFSPSGAPIQPLSDAHGDFYTDYSQLTRLIR